MHTLSMEGTCDLHIHGGPDVVDRIGTDLEIARQAQEAGMKAIVLKSVIAPSYVRAWHTRQQFPGLQVFGGVALDYHVGGINPLAVEPCIRMGGKVVWMPTYHAYGHSLAFGCIGDFKYAGGDTVTELPPPIKAVDEDGALSKDTLEVMAQCRDGNIILASGHLSTQETLTMAEGARRMGLKKFVVTHPFFKVPHMDVDTIGRLLELGAYIEFCANEMCPIPGSANLEDYVTCIRRFGSERMVLSSDAGHNRKGWPVEELRIFAQWLAYSGVPEETLHRMLCETPAQLLDI